MKQIRNFMYAVIVLAALLLIPAGSRGTAGAEITGLTSGNDSEALYG
jgi:hypothetical protein